MKPKPDPTPSARRFTWRQARMAGVVFVVAALVVLLFTRSPVYGLGVILGPFAGGVARDWQSCCAQNSLSLVPFAAAGLLVGVVVQLAVPPVRPALIWIRRVAWCLAWAIWFACAVLSYGHALE